MRIKNLVALGCLVLTMGCTPRTPQAAPRYGTRSPSSPPLTSEVTATVPKRAAMVFNVRNGDVTMAGIPHARVEVTSAGNEHFQGVTNEQGIATINVPAELTKDNQGADEYPVYTVNVHADGFKDLTVPNIQARYDDNSGAELPMMAGVGNVTIHEPKPTFRPGPKK
jgi:hypothetical protein